MIFEVVVIVGWLVRHNANMTIVIKANEVKTTTRQRPYGSTLHCATLHYSRLFYYFYYVLFFTARLFYLYFFGLPKMDRLAAVAAAVGGLGLVPGMSHLDSPVDLLKK